MPVDLRLHGYLSNLAKACPCPCAVGSRELTIAELSADSLEDLHIVARQQIEDHKLKAFDCNGATRSTLKKIFKGLITPNQKEVANGDKNDKKSSDKTSSKEAKDSGGAEVKSEEKSKS